MKFVTLTEEQARANMQLLDLATKAGGLNAAAMALPIAQTIEEQLTAPEAMSIPAVDPDAT